MKTFINLQYTVIEHSIFFMIFHKLLKNQILKKDTDKLIHCKQIKQDQNK